MVNRTTEVRRAGFLTIQSGTSEEESVVSTAHASKDPCENLICGLKLLANLHDEDSFDDVIYESVMEKEHAEGVGDPQKL